MSLNFEADGVPSELLPKPLFWQVLIAAVKVSEKSEGGIILTAQTQDVKQHYSNIGKVLAIGENAFDAPQFRGGRTEGAVIPPYKVGDIVIFNHLAGYKTAVAHNGEIHNVRILKDDAVLGKYENTAGIEALL